MKKFINNLLSTNDGVSHKRLISIVSFVVLIILAFMSAYGHTVDPNFIYVFGSLTGVESALTAIEKIRMKNQQT